MPRMAATRSSNRTFRRNRPLFEQTSAPVLFRFPNLAPSDPSDGQPQDDESGSDVPESAAIVNSVKETQASVPPRPAVAQPPVVLSGSAIVQSPEPAIATPIEAVAQTELRAEPKLDRRAEPNSDRSWWEHWSSGVVLLLLIVALITASIIAVTDSGTTDPDLLADTDSLTSIPSLVDNSRLSSVATDSTAGIPDRDKNSYAQKNTVLPVKTVQPAIEEKPVAPLLSELKTQVESADSVVLVDENPSFPKQNNSAVDELTLNAPLQTASIRPESSSDSSSNDQTLAITATTTATLSKPVSNPTATLYPPASETTTSPTAASNVLTSAKSQASQPQFESGASPQFYDGAQANLPSSPTSSDPLEISAGVDNFSAVGRPVPAKLASNAMTMNTLASQTPSSTPPPIATAEQDPSESPTASGAQLPSLTQTATPEMNREEIIRIYQEYARQRQANEDLSNRYQPR
ncbi:MAG: hypothetical protein KDB22_02500 [Planctomycetales bacterium]|nr:hypothetical protein [Planctomycetales bacterium]